MRKDSHRSNSKSQRKVLGKSVSELAQFVQLANIVRDLEPGFPSLFGPVAEADNLSNLEASSAIIDEPELQKRFLQELRHRLHDSPFSPLSQRPEWDLEGETLYPVVAFLRAVRHTFEHLVDLRRQEQVIESRKGRKHHVLRVEVNKVFNVPLPEYVFFRVGRDGKLHTDDALPVVCGWQRFREALEGLDVARVRRCCVCQKLFWAYRRDQRCCSTACNNTRAQRQWYAEHHDAKKRRTYMRAESKAVTQRTP